MINTPVCLNCCEPFSVKNVFTAAGWAETKISGLCEQCFDMICEEKDEPELDESEMITLLLQTIKHEIEVFKTRVEYHLDRMKYYAEPVSEENLRFLISELRRIERDLL